MQVTVLSANGSSRFKENRTVPFSSYLPHAYSITRHKGMKASLLLLSLLIATVVAAPHEWQQWMKHFGHDVWDYPHFVAEQMVCPKLPPPISKNLTEVTFCSAKRWLIDHRHALFPTSHGPSVSVRVAGSSFDDNIAFTLMALRAATWTKNVPVELQLRYVLPERVLGFEDQGNLRPLFFARFFPLVAAAKSTVEAMLALTRPWWTPESPNPYLNFSRYTWPDYGVKPLAYYPQWSSSTNPPGFVSILVRATECCEPLISRWIAVQRAPHK